MIDDSRVLLVAHEYSSIFFYYIQEKQKGTLEDIIIYNIFANEKIVLPHIFYNWPALWSIGQ